MGILIDDDELAGGQNTYARLAETNANIRRLSDSAHRFEATAEDARRIARLLEHEVAILHRTFSPLRTLHTSSTWEGLAASQSRRRLDRHEDEFTMELRRIDRVIDELATRAFAAMRSAEATRDLLESAQREARNLKAALD